MLQVFSAMPPFVFAREVRRAGGAELLSMRRNIRREDEIREGTWIEREEASTDEKMDDTFHSYYTRFRAAILS